MKNKQLGMIFHGYAIRSGFACDLFISNGIIDMYCKCRHKDEASNALINMYYKCSDMDEA